MYGIVEVILDMLSILLNGITPIMKIELPWYQGEIMQLDEMLINVIIMILILAFMVNFIIGDILRRSRGE